VTAAIPTEVVLKLEDLVLETGVPPDLLREALNSQLAPAYLEDTWNIREVWRKTLEKC
jgi:hypothetical protein